MMNEKPTEGKGESQENKLEHLRIDLDAAEEELAQVKAERKKIMGDLIAGGKDAAKNFREYFKKLKQAEQKAIDALEAWGNEAAKKANLKD